MKFLNSSSELGRLSNFLSIDEVSLFLLVVWWPDISNDFGQQNRVSKSIQSALFLFNRFKQINLWIDLKKGWNLDKLKLLNNLFSNSPKMVWNTICPSRGIFNLVNKNRVTSRPVFFWRYFPGFSIDWIFTCAEIWPY